VAVTVAPQSLRLRPTCAIANLDCPAPPDPPGHYLEDECQRQARLTMNQKFLAFLLKPNGDLLVFCVPRSAARAPFGGSAETGAGGVRRLLVPILLFGGFGYEDLRHRSPMAVNYRLGSTWSRWPSSRRHQFIHPAMSNAYPAIGTGYRWRWPVRVSLAAAAASGHPPRALA